MAMSRNKSTVAVIFQLFAVILCGQNTLAKYVDPFIGTGGHGHTFPGATVPFGMVQLSPDTRVDGSWDGCSGYHYSDSIVYGFSHTHLSGTGCSDYGDLPLLPLTGKPVSGKKPAASVDLSKLKAEFSHVDEKASAGFYSVKLKNKIECAFTASTRCGFHQYGFPEKYGRLVLKFDHRDKTLASDFKVVSNTIIEGYRRSEAWAKDQYIFFRMEFSSDFELENSVASVNATSTGGKKTHVPYVFLSFKELPEKILKVKVSISLVSEEGAHKNLEAEIPHWDFEKTKKEAEDLWEKELGKIVVEGDQEKKKIFYTALYHCMIHPNIANDVDGNYRGRDNKIHKTEGHNYYTVFSLWDTFRGEHPLLTIIDKKRTLDFIKTFLLQYQQGGRLPVWELASNETDCMIGYHSASVIADAVTKKIRGFDLKLALEAMQKSANWNHLGIPAYTKQNFISADDEHESVSKTLEYSYDDWCIAQVALMMNKKDDYIYYMRRSQSWKNVCDPSTGFMRPRKNGGWLSPFDPKEVNNHFTEGNSWQYSFFVPHDVYELAEQMGGQAAFEKKLDQLFSEDSKTTGREQADITGLIGQYAHGNEPSHHMAYLYNYLGKPYKTQALVKNICDNLYKAAPDGLSGNEDCGQMSAWYVLSSMGFYPVCPGSGFFEIGFPAFDKVTINLEDGKQFLMEVKNPALRKKEKCRLGRVSVAGTNLFWTKLSYEKIMAGSTMEFTLTDDMISYWGNFFAEIPPLPIKDYQDISRSPAIISAGQTFRDSMLIEIRNYEPRKYVVYSIQAADDTSVNPEFQVYKNPFWIKNSSKITAWVKESNTQVAGIDNLRAFTKGYFHKIPNRWKTALKFPYNPQYTAGGDEGVIDGLRGDKNWRKGGWQGYWGTDFEVVLDLGEEKEISEVGSGYLQDSRAWILMPKKVEYSFSSDGKKFSKLVSVANGIKDNNYEVTTADLNVQLKKSVKARYVKVRAINYGKLPAWHEGAGGAAYVFVDEVIIR
jgi:predicted alpha-1,2-mannosidase